MAEFTIDQSKINEIVRRSYLALEQEGKRLRKYMPQHNLPEEFEYSPRRQEVKEPELAAKFLFTEAFFERRMQSRQIIAGCLEAWRDIGQRWIFFPDKVAEKSASEIDKVMQKLPYTAHKGSSIEVSDKYQKNCLILRDYFHSDPRKLITGKTAEEARGIMDSFWGIGNGIANLYIAYLLERRIAAPSDPKNALLKVDIHKARIPLNVGAVLTTEREIRRDNLETALEKAYWHACDALGLAPEIIDGALWVIGSEICARKNYELCQLNCPLVDMCKAYTPESRETKKFQIYNATGRRIDVRKNFGQATLFPRQF